MSHQIGSAIIGFGYWGKILYRNIVSHDAFQLVGCIKKNPFSPADAKDFPAEIHSTDYHSVLSNPKIELIVIATPARSHVKLALEALKAGKHVLLEKPAALDMEGMNQLQTAATASGKIVMVDHTFLFTPGFAVVHSLLRDNAIGKVMQYHSTRADFGLFQTDANIFSHILYHDFYILLALFGSLEGEINSASASANIVPGIFDNATVNIKHHNGAHISLIGSLLWPQKERKIIISGSKGIILWDETAKDIVSIWNHRATLSNDGNTVTHDKATVPYHPIVPRQEALTCLLDSLSRRILSNKNEDIGSLEQSSAVVKMIQEIEAIV